MFEKYLQSNFLQFGFKQHCSTSHALLTLKTVTEYCVKGGSTVNLGALDIAKTFDRVDHFTLLKVLRDRCLPKNFIELAVEMLCLCRPTLGLCFLFWFVIQAGVRQGGCLSLVLFAILRNLAMVVNCIIQNIWYI